MTQLVSAGLLGLDRRPHVLYRFFDRADTLLYVGITMDLPKRIGDHRKGKPWWSAVDHITVEHFDGREAVLAAETEAIKTEAPLYNVSQNELVQAPSFVLSVLSPSERDRIEVPAYDKGMRDLAEHILEHFNGDFDGVDRKGWMADVRRRLTLHPPGEEGYGDEVIDQAFAAVEMAVEYVDKMEGILDRILDAFPSRQRDWHWEVARRKVIENMGEDHSNFDIRIHAAYLACVRLEKIYGILPWPSDGVLG